MTTNRFTPDIDRLYEALWPEGEPPTDPYDTDLWPVISTYEQQREAAGEVSVRREDLAEAQALAAGILPYESINALRINRLRSLLAAMSTKEHRP